MALDDLLQETTGALANQLRDALERAKEDIARAAAADREAAVAQATGALKTQLEQIRADAERAVEDQVSRMRDEVEEAAIAKIETIRAEARQATEAEVARAREEGQAELARVREEAQRAAEAQVAQARTDANTETERVRAEGQAELARVREDAQRTADEQVTRIREESARASEADLARVREEVQQAGAAELERVREEAAQQTESEISRVTRELQDAVDRELARVALENKEVAEASVTEAITGERHGQLACVDRLLEVIRRLDESRSLTEVLTALAEGAGAEAPRVAVLTAQGGRVRGWRFTGFTPDPGVVDLDVGQAGVVGRALETGTIATAEPATPSQVDTGFTTLPADRSGVAVPLLVGAAPVAVVYADDVSEAEQPKPASWPEAIELLARYASLRLENLTAVRTAQVLGMNPRARQSSPGSNAGEAGPGGSASEDEEGGARRHARLLVSEIKLYNEAAVRIGRQNRDLLERLGPEIQRARRLYSDRIPPAVRARHAYFEEELVQTLAGGDATLLGRRSDALA